jgi:hypothetical protein
VDQAAPRAAPNQLPGFDLAHRRRDLERPRTLRASRGQLEDANLTVIAHGVIKMAGLMVFLAPDSEFSARGGVGSSHILDLMSVDRLMGAGGESAFLFWNRPVLT